MIRIVKFVMLIVLLFSIQPSFVMAHTALESSVPAEGEVVNEQLKEIIMAFNTEVESLSSFKLKDEAGKEVAIQNLTVNNKTMSGSVHGKLADGEYVVEWKIVGRDGHPIEGIIDFTVKTDVVETGEVESGEAERSPSLEEIETSDEPVIEPSAEIVAEWPLSGDELSPKSSNTAIGMWIIGGIVAVALISVAVGSRRERK